MRWSFHGLFQNWHSNAQRLYDSHIQMLSSKTYNFRFRSISEKFLEGRAKHGTFFAFHGSGVENFHSIIHRGLVCALNQRRLYGFGTYLTLNYNIAFGFATHSIIWDHCKLLSKSRGVGCIAIVEVVDDPSIKWIDKDTLQPKKRAKDVDLWTQRKQCYCCVVDRDEWMQLRYLQLCAKWQNLQLCAKWQRKINRLVNTIFCNSRFMTDEAKEVRKTRTSNL